MSPVETVVYSDGATATGVAPLPRRSPAQQGHDHLCSLRRQMRFLERVKPGHADSRREIAALRWAIETLELARAASTPQPADAELRRLSAENEALRRERDEARRTVREAHEAGTHLTAQRDALLEALRRIGQRCPRSIMKYPLHNIHQEMSHDAGARARAAIKAMEGEKT